MASNEDDEGETVSLYRDRLGNSLAMSLLTSLASLTRGKQGSMSYSHTDHFGDYVIDVYGGGAAYLITPKGRDRSDGVFLQGEDAVQFSEEYNRALEMPPVVWDRIGEKTIAYNVCSEYFAS